MYSIYTYDGPDRRAGAQSLMAGAMHEDAGAWETEARERYRDAISILYPL
jgi:hypothetical protein